MERIHIKLRVGTETGANFVYADSTVNFNVLEAVSVYAVNAIVCYYTFFLSGR
jgi:hypothetical protein